MTAQQLRHESPELGAAVGRFLNALIRRAADGDQEALEALANVEGLARQATTSALTLARDRYSLNELAQVTGTTRQAVSQRADLDAPAKLTTAECDHHRCVGLGRCRVVCTGCGKRAGTFHAPTCTQVDLGHLPVGGIAPVVAEDCGLSVHVL